MLSLFLCSLALSGTTNTFVYPKSPKHLIAELEQQNLDGTKDL